MKRPDFSAVLLFSLVVVLLAWILADVFLHRRL